MDPNDIVNASPVYERDSYNEPNRKHVEFNESFEVNNVKYESSSSPIENTYLRSQQQLQSYFNSSSSSSSNNLSSDITPDTSGSAPNSVQDRNMRQIPHTMSKWNINFDMNAAAAVSSKVQNSNTGKKINVESAGSTGGGDAPSMLPIDYHNQSQSNSGLDKILMRNMIEKPRSEKLLFATSLLHRLRQQKYNGSASGSSTVASANALYNLQQHYSRKVFVGGLPPDIEEQDIALIFRRFGALVVDWPHKCESRSTYPPKGYIFLIFQHELSVQELIAACIHDENKLYMYVSSPTIKDKLVQIRPWRLTDADYVLDPNIWLDPRKTVFVGGVPRQLKAYELAVVMDRQFGGVCHASIDVDPELKYPKGAARICFLSQRSYIAAISARFIHLQYDEIEKRVEVKPYVLDDQQCDECKGMRCGNNFAPFFCANVTCLQYYCEHCWVVVHLQPGREFHKPLNKDSADRSRLMQFYKT